MSGEQHPTFDHVAIAVHAWSDGYDPLVTRFGGRWFTGGNAGEFSPGQFAFADEMKVELLQPGTGNGGFVSRFLAGHGPGAHHLTFHVDDIDEFADGCRDMGFSLVPDFVDLPGRRELFVHPKVTGFGTLVQAIQAEDHRPGGRTPPPSDLPDQIPEPSRIEWVALQVPDHAAAERMFAGVLGGTVVESASSEAITWTLFEWPPRRRLLVFSVDDDVAGRRRGGAGVDHVLFRTEKDQPVHPPSLLTYSRPSFDPRIGLPLMEVSLV